MSSMRSVAGRVDALTLILPVLALGCSERDLGLPSIQVSATSPNGRFVAYVRNHPSFDPPDQTLWIRDQYGNETKIAKLGEDSQWCNRIQWLEDSSTATFVVEGTAYSVKNVAVDARTRRVIPER
jgi:hypothetical protein